MKHVIAMICAAGTLSACAMIGAKQPEDALAPPVGGPAEAAVQVPEGALPDPALNAAPPPKAAKTAETLDTTSPEQRAAAATPVTAGASKVLGKTVASLGSPTEPGFWLKTPLVKTQGKGRVTNPANGKSSAVTLIPIDGPATAGSRMSLPAMRLIELPLTGLNEVEVSLEG
ncbi:MAG: hypothetical protein ACSHWZ_06260 [Sulfitobacter sp.]